MSDVPARPGATRPAPGHDSTGTGPSAAPAPRSAPTPRTGPALPFDAVLCEVDGVVRHYDTDGVTRLERAVGLPEGTTAAVAFAPLNDLPLLLGRISRERWAESIARELTGRVGARPGRRESSRRPEQGSPRVGRGTRVRYRTAGWVRGPSATTGGGTIRVSTEASSAAVSSSQ
ncbi:hypothetical protein [Streptomyces uncialis]|uniref:hypothetical protein n=1 Tax=Streptomyces uncialis TaxID=1048205 RepID=UPI0033DE8CC2